LAGVAADPGPLAGAQQLERASGATIPNALDKGVFAAEE
jgi:hypothetical protein